MSSHHHSDGGADGESIHDHQDLFQDDQNNDPPEDPEDPDDVIAPEDHRSLLKDFSRQWYLAQLQHKVSATAAEAFWAISRTFWPKIEAAKQAESITKTIPLFQNQRKILQKNFCPEIHMEFAFLNVTTGNVERVHSMSTPLKEYQRNPNFIKLYEEAHIQVIYLYHFFISWVALIHAR